MMGREADPCRSLAGFYLAQKFRGGNMGEVEVMGRFGGPRGSMGAGGGCSRGKLKH